MLNEISRSDLEILPEAKVMVTIPIFREFNKDYQIKSMTFSDIILASEIYEQSDKRSYEYKIDLTIYL